MATSAPRTLTEHLEAASAIDVVAGPLLRTAQRALRPRVLKEALRGSWLGHALHPLLTDVVVGSFTSATILDVLGADDDAAQALIAVGIAAYPPTALTGVSDWSDSGESDPGIRRTGLVHAAVNASALSLYAASLVARRRGDAARGRLLGFAGASALGAGGYLGGHLAYVRGARVERVAPDAGSPVA
ncbi:MAG: DUF2231 domain-containing protein [Solirubrobacteraceae bacterium]